VLLRAALAMKVAPIIFLHIAHLLAPSGIVARCPAQLCCLGPQSNDQPILKP